MITGGDARRSADGAGMPLMGQKSAVFSYLDETFLACWFQDHCMALEGWGLHDYTFLYFVVFGGSITRHDLLFRQT